jgi:hypothetical protein
MQFLLHIALWFILGTFSVFAWLLPSTHDKQNCLGWLMAFLINEFSPRLKYGTQLGEAVNRDR